MPDFEFMSDGESYTPGYGETATGFMARRQARTHAGYLLPHVFPSARILDCGCGPGSITCDLAAIAHAGHVTGIDREPSQVRIAGAAGEKLRLANIDFTPASVYALPFDPSSFDIVHAHAVFEHLADPMAALSEMHRVLKPGGRLAIRSPDWGGFLVAPETEDLIRALRTYADIQNGNGGDTRVGRKLPALVQSAGFIHSVFSASYDCNQPPSLVGDYLAAGLEAAGCDEDARIWRSWGSSAGALFAQAWCEIITVRPPAPDG